jgi:hypothetical protein
MVVGQPHENGLAAAPLGQEKFTRGQVRMHGDGVGSLEIVYRQPEGLGHVDAGSQVVLDLQRDDLGVRGDRGWNPAPGGFHGRFEFDIVVDVAVETGVNDGTAFKVEPETVLSTGWQLGSVMAPTEAQRVWDDTV